MLKDEVLFVRFILYIELAGGLVRNEIGLRTGRDSWTYTELYILYETRCLSAQYSFRVISRVTASQVKLRTLQSAIAGRVTLKHLVR